MGAPTLAVSTRKYYMIASHDKSATTSLGPLQWTGSVYQFYIELTKGFMYFVVSQDGNLQRTWSPTVDGQSPDGCAKASGPTWWNYGGNWWVIGDPEEPRKSSRFTVIVKPGESGTDIASVDVTEIRPGTRLEEAMVKGHFVVI